ncbi:MAG: glycosyltransferase family 2 protein [Acidobacteriia bacterium]|nr:glycosyltransferase family 2 protein [Terriglobia bacterium]
MNPPKVTVLTAVRNGARLLGETIESIRAQTFTDWEYIIVDDASDDQTAEVVEKATLREPRLRLIRRATAGGPYAAANDGLRWARSDYIVRIDGDDLAPPGRIQQQYDFLEKNPQYRACVTFWQGFNQNGLIPGSVTPVPLSCGVFRWYLLLRSPSLHSAVCYQRSLMEELGGYREWPLSQDYRLWCELTRRNLLGVIPEVLCYVRSHPGRESLTKRSLQRKLALDILSEHLTALCGQIWSREDLNALWSVGHSETMPVAKGLEMLDRWDALWRSAKDLSGGDRRELRQLSSMRRWKHLRANARREPLAAALNGFKCLRSVWTATAGVTA